MKALRRVTAQRRRPGRNWRRTWCAVTAGGVAVAVSLTATPALAATLVRSGGVPERGIDISAYQNANGPINWRELARHGIRFVAIKASESTYYKNPYYRSDARAAARAGLDILPYVFANPDRADGSATATFAVRAARYHRGHGALPLVVDLENDPYSVSDCYWQGRGRMISWIEGFTRRARALTGAWPIIYTTAAWWQQCTGSTRRFRHDPLWLASYESRRPAALSPWSRWSFWQYSENGYLPGIGWTDLDVFQSASGLSSLRPAPERKAKHKKPKPKPKKPKHKKPKPKPKKPKHKKPKPKPKRKKPKPKKPKHKKPKPKPKRKKPKPKKPKHKKPKPKPKRKKPKPKPKKPKHK